MASELLHLNVQIQVVKLVCKDPEDGQLQLASVSQQNGYSSTSTRIQMALTVTAVWFSSSHYWCPLEIPPKFSCAPNLLKSWVSHRNMEGTSLHALQVVMDPLVSWQRLNLMLVQFKEFKKVVFDAGSIKVFLWINLSHEDPPGFAVGLLSGQSVLDYTKAQSSLQLCCTLSYSLYAAITAVSPFG